MVKNGDVAANHRVLKEFGVTPDTDFNNDINTPVWGEAQTSGQRISLQSQDTAEGSIPNVTGYGLRDALYRLENAGLQVNVVGTGVVVQQSIMPGTAYKKGESITITLSPTENTSKK